MSKIGLFTLVGNTMVPAGEGIKPLVLHLLGNDAQDAVFSILRAKYQYSTLVLLAAKLRKSIR